MRQLIATILVLLVVFTGTTALAKQTPVTKDVLNALANAIAAASAGDTLLLSKDGFYPNQGTVTITVPLTLMATGTGTFRPVIFQAAKSGGTYDTRDFQLNCTSFTAIGIHFDGDHGDGSYTRYGLSSGLAGIVLRYDGCAFSNYFGRTIDMIVANNKLTVTNCIFSADVKRTGFDEGRPIDTRQFAHDTIFVQNTTFFNVTDRFFRHYTGTGYAALNWVIIDHCTFAYGYNYRPGFQFGLIKNLQFTNNIVLDPGMLGTDSVTIRKNEVDYAEKDIRVFSAVDVVNQGTTITMLNNNVYLEPSVQSIFAAANPDSVKQAPWFNAEFLSRIDVNKAMFSENLTFTNVPGPPLPVITAFANSPRTPITQTAMNLRHPDSVSFAYNTNSISYTAAGAGYPLGDLNWFPTRKAAWLAAGKPVTGVEEQQTIPDRFGLEQNYPNPFNPSTVVSYQVPVVSTVNLRVYDLLGREVAVLVNKQQSPGQYTVAFNAAGLPSGVYVYRLTAGQFSESRKMVLTK